MSSFTQLLYQIVFSTFDAKNTLKEEGQKRLYTYIWEVLKKQKCHTYRIGGVENHIHIITSIHPAVAVADIVKDIKLAARDFIKKENLFPMFDGWSTGYGAFSYSISAKDNLIEYVKNQKEHHKKVSFKDEYIALLKEHGIDYDIRELRWLNSPS